MLGVKLDLENLPQGVGYHGFWNQYLCEIDKFPSSSLSVRDVISNLIEIITFCGT